MEMGRYYGYPNYWGTGGLWGAGCYPGTMYPGAGGAIFAPVIEQGNRNQMEHSEGQRSHGDPHLRSCNAVIQYHIHAADGDIGHVQGMLVDEKSWAIRYLVINTSNWWLGHEVLVAPEWITDVSWKERTVVLDLSRQAIKDSPHWDPALLPDRPQEAKIYQHYGRKGYWEYETLASMAPPSHTERPRPLS